MADDSMIEAMARALADHVNDDAMAAFTSAQWMGEARAAWSVVEPRIRELEAEAADTASLRAKFAKADTAVQRVRELHALAPTPSYPPESIGHLQRVTAGGKRQRPECVTCDNGMGFGDNWPCDTARAVYSEDEIREGAGPCVTTVSLASAQAGCRRTATPAADESATATGIAVLSTRMSACVPATKGTSMTELDLDAIEARAKAALSAYRREYREALNLCAESAADVDPLVAENRALRAEVERLREFRQLVLAEADVDGLRNLAADAWLSGFQVSAEGWNGEYPYDHAVSLDDDDLKVAFQRWWRGLRWRGVR